MMTQSQLRVTLIFILVLLLLAACRKDEQEPTPLPTAAAAATLPATEEPAEPTAVPATAVPATAVPIQQQAIDPEQINWAPTIIDSSPHPNEELTLDGAIMVRFDQPMDQTSVEQAMTVVNNDTGQAVTGDFTWTRPDTLLFTPKTELRSKQQYRITIDESAQGINGLPINVPVELLLETSGLLAVNQVIPADGANGVAVSTPITVLFNRPVVPLVSTGQQELLPQPLQFNPPLEGTGEWTSTSIYRFMPDPGLDGATTYNVSIDPELTDVTGVPLDSAYSWQFTTLSPDVVTVWPEETQFIRADAPLTVTFNMAMDTAVTEAAISMRSVSTSAAPLSFTWTDGDQVVTIQPRGLLQLDTVYQLVIEGSAQAANGQATMGEPRIYPFETYPYPAIISVFPQPGSTPEFYEQGATIYFASPMDWDTLDEQIRIEPAPARVRYYFNDYDNSISLSFSYELDAVYTITVPGAAADPYGNTLGEDQSWQFTAPPSPPLASLNLPQNQSYLSTSFPTNVDVIVGNVSQVDAALYNLGLPMSLISNPWDVRDYNPATAPISTWNIPLTLERNSMDVISLPLANGGALPTGVYLLEVNAPELTENDQWWQNMKNMVIMADTNVVVKEMFGDVYVWVTDIAAGTPVAGRSLALYSAQGVQIGTAVSDANGFAQFDYFPTNNYLEGVTVVSNNPGEAGFGVGNSTWSNNATPWQAGLTMSYDDEVANKAYIYTDRPIYRPGDTVYYKGIVRQAGYGRYALTAPQDLQMTLSFVNYYSENSFNETLDVVVGADGTFNGAYELPLDLPLGTYQFLLQGQLFDYTAARDFTVAEYRRPEFQITMTTETPDALRGETVDVTLEVQYFFGGTAADLPVFYAIYEEAYVPDVPGPYYCWSDCGRYFYEDLGFFFGGGEGAFGAYVMDGQGVTDRNGRLTITLPADLLAEVEAGSRRVTVEATVQDISEFPISSRIPVVFHAAETAVGIKALNYIPTAGEATAVEVKTVDWAGQAAGGQPVEVVFYRREWVPTRTQDYGMYYTAWDVVDTEVDRDTAVTDANGIARISFVPAEGGEYLAIATVTDGGGRQAQSSTSLWVTGVTGWQTDPRDSSMDLIPDKTEYAVGETARVLVQSPFDVPTQAWLTLERGALISQRLVTIPANGGVVEIPVTADFPPNAFVTVTAVKPANPDNPNAPYAEIRMGMAELVVPPTLFNLNVQLTPRDAQLSPGETAVYDILTTDANGTAVSADISLALVDLAILTLKADNAPHILDFFYERQPYRSQQGGGLFISGEGLEVEIPLQGGGMGGGGGDLEASEAVARVGDGEEEDVRRYFPDTAFWQANLQTDASGQGVIEIPLPDTLTTWRLSSKANTADTLVGQGSVDIVSTLPLLIRPVTPRFFTVGDTVQLGAVINNNTDAPIEASVSLEVANLALLDAAEQTVIVPAMGQVLVRWATAVADVEFVDGQAFADLTFRVEGGDYSDATKPSFGEGPDNLIPIVRYNALDVVGSSGQLDEAGRIVEAVLLPPGVDMDQGTVVMQLSPSLGAALLDSLNLHNNLDYWPDCPASVVDRLLPNTAVAGLLQRVDVPELEAQYGAEVDTVINTSVSQLHSMVMSDGGWGWCSNSDESNLFVTASALLGLTKAQQTGYDVDEAILDDAVRYVANRLENPADFRNSTEANGQAFYLYVLAEAGADVAAELDLLFDEARDLLDPYATGLLLSAYELSSGNKAAMDTLTADLNDAVVQSATGAHWEDAVPDWANLSSDIRGTAMVLQALARTNPDDVMAAPAVRWLMAARLAARWTTLHENAWVIYALTDWLAETGELEADYEYGVQVNLQPLADGSFTAENIAESRLIPAPIPGLLADEANFFEFRRGEGDGRMYYTLHLNAAIDAAMVSAVDRGIHVERAYFDAACDPDTQTCEPITEIAVGQPVRVVLTFIAENDLLQTVVEDPLPAGAEASDPNLDTTAGQSGGFEQVDMRGYWGWWLFNRVEFRDEKVVFLAESLPAGTYQYTYTFTPVIPGAYQVMPTTAWEQYFPEVNGRGDGMLFTITE
jgi:uncharacterized protein YfaS (alpha-2-macroglobulin family)